MITNNEIKLIRALKNKKQRDKMNMFLAEGEKLVEHLSEHGLERHKLFCLESYAGVLKSEAQCISVKEMHKISALDSPSVLLGVFIQPKYEVSFSGDVLLALDDVRDPGNMGTIIRLADWFGVHSLFVSPQCVDVFNPKVVQSTMGSLSNVNVVKQPLDDVFRMAKSLNYKIIGAEMNGVLLSDFKVDGKVLLVMGNEANGIHSDNQKLLDQSITIAQAASSTAESLNVGTATAILLGQLSQL